MSKTYFIVVNYAQHDGRIVVVSDEVRRSGEFHYSKITNDFKDTILSETADLSEAEAILINFLRCSTLWDGMYCAKHNPFGK